MRNLIAQVIVAIIYGLLLAFLFLLNCIHYLFEKLTGFLARVAPGISDNLVFFTIWMVLVIFLIT